MVPNHMKSEDFLKRIEKDLKGLTTSINNCKEVLLQNYFTLNDKIANDLTTLRVESHFKIPGSKGIGYEASEFIPEHNLVAFGTYHDRKSDLVLFDIDKKMVKTRLDNIHNDGVTYVRWIPEFKAIITCSYDKNIKLFRYEPTTNKIWHLQTLRGHS